MTIKNTHNTGLEFNPGISTRETPYTILARQPGRIILVYAAPGMGKTTAVGRAIQAGCLAVDIDQFYTTPDIDRDAPPGSRDWFVDRECRRSALDHWVNYVEGLGHAAASDRLRYPVLATCWDLTTVLDLALRGYDALFCMWAEPRNPEIRAKVCERLVARGTPERDLDRCVRAVDDADKYTAMIRAAARDLQKERDEWAYEAYDPTLREYHLYPGTHVHDVLAHHLGLPDTPHDGGCVGRVTDSVPQWDSLHVYQVR